MYSGQQIAETIFWLSVGVAVSLWWRDYRKLKRDLDVFRRECGAHSHAELSAGQLVQVRRESEIWATARADNVIERVEKVLGNSDQFKGVMISRIGVGKT